VAPVIWDECHIVCETPKSRTCSSFYVFGMGASDEKDGPVDDIMMLGKSWFCSLAASRMIALIFGPV
jgi:hypothetical protein